LWGQKHRLIGFNPSPIGYWDKPHGATGFSPLGKFFKVRAENETL
jgi:hypothetical protein